MKRGEGGVPGVRPPGRHRVPTATACHRQVQCMGWNGKSFKLASISPAALDHCSIDRMVEIAAICQVTRVCIKTACIPFAAAVAA
jgi:hypothetical protein